MKDSIVEKQLEVYQQNFIDNINNPQGKFHNSRAIQWLRFERVVKNLELETNRYYAIHDIGSGTCELHEYLMSKNIEHDYSGTEIVPEMIEQSLKKYPYIQLFNRDLLNDNITDTYDWVILSGTLNLPGSISKENWEVFTYKLLDRMFSMCKMGISFNFLTSYSDFYNDLMFYLDSKSVMDYCIKNYSRFVNIDHSYPLYEVSVTVYTEEFMKRKYTHPSFQKYFKNK